MAQIKLNAWLAANEDYDKFRGTAAGVPVIYQAAEGAPSLDAKDWTVWDYAPELPDTNQAPSNADISPTGKINRIVIPIVPDAPSATDIAVFLGEDTDATFDAVEEFEQAYQTAIAGGKTLYLAHFLGIGKKSKIYAAAVSWSKSVDGAFPDPLTTNVSITPNLGVYNKLQVITNGNISG